MNFFLLQVTAICVTLTSANQAGLGQGQYPSTCILAPPGAQQQQQLQQPLNYNQGKSRSPQQPQPVFVPQSPQISQTATSIDNLSQQLADQTTTTNNPFFPSGYQYNPNKKGNQDSNSGVFFNDQPAQYAPPSGIPSENRPNVPVYDRSGFRREPLHPSFTPQNSPVVVDGRGGSKGSSGSWSRFNNDQQQQQVQGESGKGSTPGINTGYFDSTRRPKVNAPTGSRASPGSRSKARTQQQQASGKTATSQRPYFFSPNPQQPVPTTPSPPINNNSNNPFRNRTNQQNINIRDKSVLGPNDPSISSSADGDGVQTVPEYAFVKQPINKVLDQPDLDLDGKPVKFTIMKDALYRVGLLELISGSGPVTLFTPSDDAFLSLPPETLSRLQQNPAFLRTTMLRHIVNFDVPPHLLKNNIIIPTYSGEPLIINVLNKGKLMLVRGVPIVAATNTENGVIYVLDKVLTEETSSSNVLEELQLRPELSTFYNYLQRTPVILRKLQGQGPFTILAPNNSAFEELSPVTRQVLEYNPVALEKLLSSHVVEGAVYSKELEGRESLKLVDGEREEEIKVQTTPDGKVTVNEGPVVTKADISTGNGVIHLIDGILIPPNLLVTFKQLEARTFFNRQPISLAPNDLRNTATSNRRNSQLAVRDSFKPLLLDQSRLKGGSALMANTTRFYKWLQKSGFMDVLNNTRSNYTIILPTDKAVNRLPLKYQTTLEQNSKQLESLLMYHIIPGTVNMSRLKDEDTLATVSGKDVRFNKYSQMNDTNLLTLSGAPIVGTSEIEEGRINFVITDRVMYPPQGNLFEIISKSPILRSLTNLVNVANLQTELSVSGPFTLFAPSDQAFNKLTPESIGYLSHDAESSRAFLLRHIVRPIIFTSSVPMGNSSIIENTAGERLEMFREPDRVKIDGVGVMYADITATNGVIHVIDHVL